MTLREFGNNIFGFGLIVQPMPHDDETRILYAEVEPAYSRWLPWPGRTSRWWYEVHAIHAEDEHGVGATTYAYVKGGSGGAFTFSACVRKAQDAVSHFASEPAS